MDLSSFHKARKLAVAHDHVPVNSDGKQMNEDLNNVNKDTIESKVNQSKLLKIYR